ncbi:MAG: phosphate acetyltransferase [Ignavibacteriaceae bacterium]
MSLKIIDEIKEKASQKKKTIILPESSDERVLKAAEILTKEEIVSVITIGSEKEIKAKASKENVDLSGITIVDQLRSEHLDNFANIFYELRKNKGISIQQAKETVQRDLFFAALMIREGMADGAVSGSLAATADVLRAGIMCIGLKKGISIVSSFFLMIKPEKTYTFADCGAVVDPDAKQLADITISSSDNHKKLTGEEPYIAMLSFSTKGSAKHEKIDKVIEAMSYVKVKRPDLHIDGELQFDAAVVDSIAERKAPGSEVAGKANVLIFPDLNAGNIGYKLAQRWGKAEAIGPLVQGLNKPFSDLSRGCSVNDIVINASIAVLMSI